MAGSKKQIEIYLNRHEDAKKLTKGELQRQRVEITKIRVWEAWDQKILIWSMRGWSALTGSHDPEELEARRRVREEETAEGNETGVVLRRDENIQRVNWWLSSDCTNIRYCWTIKKKKKVEENKIDPVSTSSKPSLRIPDSIATFMINRI